MRFTLSLLFFLFLALVITTVLIFALFSLFFRPSIAMLASTAIILLFDILQGHKSFLKLMLVVVLPTDQNARVCKGCLEVEKQAENAQTPHEVVKERMRSKVKELTHKKPGVDGNGNERCIK